MRINLAGMAQNNFMSTQKVMSGTVRISEENRDAKLENEQRRDIATITPQGKAKNLLENLMKQKTNIIENKNALVASTIEKGGSMDSIKSQLEVYDAQMKNIDDQIAEMMAKEIEKQVEEGKSKEQGGNEPKTEEEIQNQRLAGITNLSVELEQIETTNSAKIKIDGDIRVLKSEIALDKTRSGSLGGSDSATSKKEVKLADMEKASLNVTANIGDKLAEVSEKASEINKALEYEKEEE